MCGCVLWDNVYVGKMKRPHGVQKNGDKTKLSLLTDDHVKCQPPWSHLIW